jgi:tRNA(His) 5'-end guanylyltransferase
MKDDFEPRMRAGECFHSLRVPPNAFTVVRVDGRSFSALTERLASKPFDEKFHEWMVRAASGLLESLQAVYAFTESDEISVLMPRDSDLFDREVEKLVSISAARASAIVSLACGVPVEFDSRIWVGARDEDVVDYFAWRQADGARCALHGWCYWTLRKSGMSAAAATARLQGVSVGAKNELLFSHGINFNEVPAWQRRGAGVHWESYEKAGFNPITRSSVVAVRRRVAIDRDLPMKDEYAAYVRARLV